MSFHHIDRRAFSSYYPDYGAIFMANDLTKEECLEKRLFGLPANFSDFVFRIKVGMLLFLFDYHSRKLYGVFEASSDGGWNLVPDAYKSSRLKFPAQVRFKVLWQCAPLQEDAFRDAIMENYFAPYKFNFGLSKEQVRRLLYMFERTKLKLQHSHMSLLTTMKPLPKSMPKKHAGLDDPIDDNIGYQIYELRDEKENQVSRNSRGSKLCSDNEEERLSVFKRLSGLSRVIEENSGRVNARTEHLGKSTNFENVRDILNSLDTKHTIWHSLGEKASNNTSVISGLGDNVKMGAKNEPPGKLSGTMVEICKDSKRKDTLLADKQQKRKCLRKAKTCDELSDVPNLSQGKCKTVTSVIVTGDGVVITGPSLTKPFICGGGEDSVDNELHHSIQLETSCDQDPVEMLLAQYKDYLLRSRIEDQTDRNGAHTCVI